SDTLTVFYAFLAQNPEYRRQIVEHPDIIPSAVEELFRWESPVPIGIARIATQDVELPNGHLVKEGTTVTPCFGAANLDSASIQHPSEARFARTPNPPLAFGGGVPRCLGSHLARRELRIALLEWHQRIPDYTIKPGHENLELKPGALRHVKDLMLTWH